MTGPSRRPTLKDVAARAGLSVMVASYTFARPERVSAASRERILAAADELGYSPHQAARALRTGSTNLIGVVVSEHLSYAFTDPGARAFLSGVADACASSGRGIVLLSTRAHAAGRSSTADPELDGYIFWTTTQDDVRLAEARRSGRPVVVQGGPELDGITRVGIDDRAAARSVSAAGLRGAQNPAVISFPTGPDRRSRMTTMSEVTSELPVTTARLDGIAESLSAEGFDASVTPCVVLSENNRILAERATHDLIAQRPETDAIIAMSDEIALGALAALAQESRSVPGHVTLTGFDATPEALHRGMTTIKQDLYQQGAAAVETIVGGSAAPTAAWELIDGLTTR